MSENKNVLVTGGAGYVGSHVCKALSQNGFLPIAYDNLSNGHEWAVKWGPFVEGDIGDTPLLTEVIKSCRPCAVMHFAASIEVGESVKNPLKYYRNNVGGTLSLLAAMQAGRVDKMIFSSSCAVYGMTDGPFLVESCLHRPVSPYGRTKSMVEQLLADVAAEGKFSYVALRYFNASGADPDGEIGEAHDPESHLIPLAIAAAQGEAPLRIFGTDFNTPDGTAIRDYTHVCDLAEAHVLALKYLLVGQSSEAFNIGSGTGHSVREVIEGLRKLGYPISPQIAGRRPGDPARLVADATKIFTMLGWQPQMSDLMTILATAVAWYKKLKASPAAKTA
jgi:UDP-glucose-4-epimerase GalE